MLAPWQEDIFSHSARCISDVASLIVIEGKAGHLVPSTLFKWRCFSFGVRSPWIAHRRRGERKISQNQPYFCFVMGKLDHNLRRVFFGMVVGKQTKSIWNNFLFICE